MSENNPNEVDIVPSDNEIRKYNELSKEDWMHPFCKSCYVVYKKQCNDIDIFLDIKKEGNLLNISEIRSKIDTFIDETIFDQEYLYKLEYIINLLFDCITSR